MKITLVKAMIAKVFTVGLLAGAVVMAAPSKAEAQIGIGVRIGGPAHYYGPVARGPVVLAPRPVFGYGYGPGFYGHPYGWDHREGFYRHEDRRFYR